MPSPGVVTKVPAGSSLAAAVNAAACGDTLVLHAGATYQASGVTISKTCDASHWLTITTDGDLPDPGNRFNLQSASQVPLLTYTSDSPLTIGVSYIHLRGVGFVKTPGPWQLTSMIAFVPGTHHIVFGQDYAHGNPGEETRRFLQTSGASYVALVSSYVGEIHCIDATGACSDAQAVAGGLGDNPSKAIWIVNNYLESSGENILFGGGEATTVPSDITVMNNWLRKPPCWNPNAPNFCSGVKYIVKNHFELKSATRMWVEGNVMEGAWGGFSS